MKTVKQVITNDTLIVRTIDSVNKVEEKNTIQTTLQEDCNCWGKNICECQLLTDLLWPITVLIILFTFKNRVNDFVKILIKRIEEGASVEFTKDGFKIQASPQEIIHKLENDIRLTSDHLNEAQKTNYISKAVEIEKQVRDMFLKNLYQDYQVLYSQKVQGRIFDLILTNKKRKGHDCIVEIKYFPNSFKDIDYGKVAKDMEYSSLLFSNSFSRDAKLILVVIINKDSYKFDVEKTVKEAINNPLINILVINEDKILEVDRLDILKLVQN